jgi:hypothetical protein
MYKAARTAIHLLCLAFELERQEQSRDTRYVYVLERLTHGGTPSRVYNDIIVGEEDQFVAGVTYAASTSPVESRPGFAHATNTMRRGCLRRTLVGRSVIDNQNVRVVASGSAQRA